MKIRRYVMNLTQKANGEMIQLPTILELSEKFNVSRPTVSKALKTLTDEGYVLGKPGIGSFTNPAIHKVSAQLKNLPVVGILMGDGMLVHYEQFLGSSLGNLLIEITSMPAIVHLVSLSSGSPENFIRDIENENLDALISHGAKEEKLPLLLEMEKKGLKIVRTDHPELKNNDVSFDYEKLGYECAKLLIREGRKNPVFLMNRPPWNAPLEGIRKSYRESEISLNEKLFFQDFSSGLDDLDKLLSLGIPVDAVYSPVAGTDELRLILAKHAMNDGKLCRILHSSIGNENRSGDIVFEYPFNEQAKSVRKMLIAKLSGETVSCKSELIPVPIKYID